MQRASRIYHKSGTVRRKISSFPNKGLNAWAAKTESIGNLENQQSAETRHSNHLERTSPLRFSEENSEKPKLRGLSISSRCCLGSRASPRTMSHKGKYSELGHTATSGQETNRGLLD
ncbi:unnamed protein product [Nesidiocoris tenuis]|uniref:Uncharacterized protein n=1 Tax=Nesidiocoris tenuis TaxID=355587 RepID=A0A6H5GDN0_9HEMI|nr:unnamed protein product [Nesidiocoris tenuis]